MDCYQFDKCGQKEIRTYLNCVRSCMDDVFKTEVFKKSDLHYQSLGQFGALVNLKKVEDSLGEGMDEKALESCVKEAKEVARICQAFDREGEFYCASSLFDELNDCLYDLNLTKNKC